MRYLILSDMHGNGAAFDAVLDSADPATFETILVLGDLVGYGGDPDHVVETVRGLPGQVVAVRGNHDKVVSGIDDGENFNQAALAAARWTRANMSEENMTYVRQLPQGPTQIARGTSICHGSPLDEDAYVFSDYDAFEIFARHNAELTFFGHTHVPSLFSVSPDGIDVRALKGEGTLQLMAGTRYLINPGSIGQPRDHDPRAAYMTYDDESRRIQWYRVDYPIDQAQERIREAGLPSVLAERLSLGV